MEKYRPPSSSTSDDPTPPLKRRRVASDPGEFSSHTPLAGNKRRSAPPSSVSLSLYSFSTHGWRFHDETRAGKTLASVWKSIVPDVKQWEEIRGEMIITLQQEE